MRILISRNPYQELDRDRPFTSQGIWPCRWIQCKGNLVPPFVTAYRKRFTLTRAAKIRVHVSADERYQLYLDGRCIGRGSERGDKDNWFFETYELDMEKGRHVIVAKAWSLGPKAPCAQLSVHPGFIFSPEGKWVKLLGTGVATWEAKRLGGFKFGPCFTHVGSDLFIDGNHFSWGFETGKGEGWQPAQVLAEGTSTRSRFEYNSIHLMTPAQLPAMWDQPIRKAQVKFVSGARTKELRIRNRENLAAELGHWQKFLDGVPITIKAGTRRNVLVDLGNYYCAYVRLTATGGQQSQVQIRWAESLFEKCKTRKGNRDEIEGKTFIGVGDRFKIDGAAHREYETLWWRSGRYIEISVRTADRPLTLENLTLHETRYPLEMESRFTSSEENVNRVIPAALRGLQMCAHETYLDCPYYEQLMYAGDTRLMALMTYAITRDDRLPRKALQLFDASRLSCGLTQSRYPSRITQIIPPFALWWVGMVYDYALWRNDQSFVRSLMPGVRAVMDTFDSMVNRDGLLEIPFGWNFVDWVPAWRLGGVPPENASGISGIMNWQMVWTLSMAAELEAWLGETELAGRYRRRRTNMAQTVTQAFWDDRRCLFADDRAKSSFSEHAQCMAVLSGQVDLQRQSEFVHALIQAQNLARTTIYFTHYLFETYRRLRQMAPFFDRLQTWFELGKNGFKTPFETLEPSRSDCHGWGSHPLYHFFTSILGIRPGAMGFVSVTIDPQLGPLTWAKGTLVHPQGEIRVDLRKENGKLQGYVCLPKGVTGTFLDNGKPKPLYEGMQQVCTKTE